MKFLGFQVEQGKIQPVKDKVEKISEWKVPRYKKEIQIFKELAGYYRQFVPNFAEIAAPLIGSLN